MIVLAVLRHDQRVADMAGGNDVSEYTVRSRRDELIGLLAAQAPRLDRALKKVTKQGGEAVLIDGTPIRTQRRSGKADRRNYAGNHRSHGLHVLALTDENGRLIWTSAAQPGRTHDNAPPATTTSWPNYVPPASGHWPTSASAAWTTTSSTP
ncbi:transposase family protein [Streptomyces sp. AC602_WCS936]|uniref:transposase family protein n=1 Tax=Streptomyces sp. AC602_WCS936 TaxID=2823685 RepID=UPI001C27E6AD|nr:transposase family protein [Streptomyces sp. AC602_WCS936]